MRSQLLIKRADVLNELLAGPEEKRPYSSGQYDNPFASKTEEEHAVVSSLEARETTKFLPGHAGVGLDEDVKKEIELDKKSSDDPRAWIEKARTLTPTEIKLLKLVQRKSGQDPITAIMGFSGMNSRQLLQALNRLASLGYIGIKGQAPVSTDTTERLLKTVDALKSGTVVASWKASLLHR